MHNCGPFYMVHVRSRYKCLIHIVEVKEVQTRILSNLLLFPSFGVNLLVSSPAFCILWRGQKHIMYFLTSFCKSIKNYCKRIITLSRGRRRLLIIMFLLKACWKLSLGKVLPCFFIGEKSLAHMQHL